MYYCYYYYYYYYYYYHYFLQAEDLLSLTQPARVLVEAGLVLAVQDVEGQSRHARISLEHGRLHLYSLQALATPPPPHAITLQVGQVRSGHVRSG